WSNPDTSEESGERGPVSLGSRSPVTHRLRGARPVRRVADPRWDRTAPHGKPCVILRSCGAAHTGADVDLERAAPQVRGVQAVTGVARPGGGVGARTRDVGYRPRAPRPCGGAGGTCGHGGWM